MQKDRKIHFEVWHNAEKKIDNVMWEGKIFSGTEGRIDREIMG